MKDKENTEEQSEDKNPLFEEIRTPFSPIQVELLNEYQKSDIMHPFTCMGIRCKKRTEQENEGILIATEEGWICPCGQYTQLWAHAFMLTIKEMKERRKNMFNGKSA